MNSYQNQITITFIISLGLRQLTSVKSNLGCYTQYMEMDELLTWSESKLVLNTLINVLFYYRKSQHYRHKNQSMKSKTVKTNSGVSQCSKCELKLCFMEFKVAVFIVYKHFQKDCITFNFYEPKERRPSSKTEDFIDSL